MDRPWKSEAWSQLRLSPEDDPFLMALTSPSDHWGFISSYGGLTLGRVEAERCLFPYETDDRLHRAHNWVGPTTRLEFRRAGHPPEVVEPWRSAHASKQLFKHPLGHQLVFEASLEPLGLRLTYRWAPSTTLGWVRSCWLERLDGFPPMKVRLIDGLRGVMPPNVHLGTYQGASCLVDAYRRAELLGTSSCALFTMESQISDRPEPKESLRANLAWSVSDPRMEALQWGLHPKHLEGSPKAQGAHLLLGEPSAYLMDATLTLEAGAPPVSWHQVLDVYLDHVALSEALHQANAPDAGRLVAAAIASTSAELEGFVDALDGTQASAEIATTRRHVMSALFNGMRGGLPLHAMALPFEDLTRYVASRSRSTRGGPLETLAELREESCRESLLEAIDATGDQDLARIALEYLPLGWGRRHGGPSRPWNRFSIHLKDEQGAPKLHYEGNWRDIFQNWEALAWSYPGFLDAFVARFVGASSADGFNPYRISRDGVDWEVPEPEDPWAHIGYWGDHQGPYLERLVSLLKAAWPARFEALLAEHRFGYVDIPYRLGAHAQMLATPKSTIRFDFARDAQINEALAERGEDARLLQTPSGGVHTVTLMEKLLVATLARLGQFVVGGGVWMSTQRPEWNDANNALAGEGLSLVSTAYLARTLRLLIESIQVIKGPTMTLSASVKTWLEETRDAYRVIAESLEDARINDTLRRAHLDAVALPYERHRERVYSGDIGPCVSVDKAVAHELCALALNACEWTLRRARRGDGLFGAYTLMVRHADGSLGVKALPLMLEGQVAILASGILNAEERVEVLEALFASGLYRADQDSFTLMVPRPRRGFLDINSVDPGALSSETLEAAKRWDILRQDRDERWRFHPDLSGSAALNAALDEVDADAGIRDAIQACFEATFDHHSFLGRSGTMYKYEGIGCIYWHMVAKLLLATGESVDDALAERAPVEHVARLTSLYHRVRDGLGFRRSYESYGAFPTDPYSHTPAHRGAQQPGMTGLVKEDLLTRYLELGVRLRDGCLSFEPHLLERTELLASAGDFRGHRRPAQSLAFSLAGVSVIYQLGDASSLTIVEEDGSQTHRPGSSLDLETSHRWLSRVSAPSALYVTLRAESLYAGAS